MRWSVLLLVIMVALLLFGRAPPLSGVGRVATVQVEAPPTDGGGAHFPLDYFVGYLTRLSSGDETGNAYGTTFSVDSARGLWVTARHVVEGCPLVLIDARGGLGAVVDEVVLHPYADVALLRSVAVAPELLVASKDSEVPSDAAVVGWAGLRLSSRILELVGWTRSYVDGGARGAFDSIVWRKSASFGARTDGGGSGAPVVGADGVVRAMLVSASPDGREVGALATGWLAEFLAAQGVPTERAEAPLRRMDPALVAGIAAHIEAEGSVRPVYCVRDGAARSRTRGGTS